MRLTRRGLLAAIGISVSAKETTKSTNFLTIRGDIATEAERQRIARKLAAYVDAQLERVRSSRL